MAEVAVRGVDVIAVYRGDAAEMRIAVAGMALRVRRLTRCGFGKDRRREKRRGDGAGAEIRGPPKWIPPIKSYRWASICFVTGSSSRASGLASICCLVSRTDTTSVSPMLIIGSRALPAG